MSWISVVFWLLPRRLRSSWALLAVTSFGILTAVTLMAVGVVYSNALAEGGLRHTLASTSAKGLHAQVVVQNRPLGTADYDKLRRSVEETNEARMGHILRDTVRSGRIQSSMPLVMTPDGQTPPRFAHLGQPFFLTGFEEHARIVEGRWPEAEPVFDDNGVDMEIVVGTKIASDLRWEVGTQVYLIPFRAYPSERVALSVVGLVEPINPAEEYWLTSGSYYFNTQLVDPVGILVPMYVPEETFFGGLGARYPSLIGDYWWLLFLDTGMLTAATAGPTKDAIVGLQTDLGKMIPRSQVFSFLEATIADYQRELTLARVPIFLFLSLVVAVILYFLVIVLGLLARTQTGEASLLRSRGASVLQVSGLFALGEGTVVLLSTALGPFLALGIVRYLLVSTIDPAGEGGFVPVGLSLGVFVVGGIGGLLSLAVLTASGVGLARMGIMEFLEVRARPPTVPLLHRYYVDILVLAVLGLIWWQIEDREGFIQRDLAGVALKEVDLSMLFGPVLVLLAAAFLILRLLPLLMRALALLGTLLAPAWVSFTLTRMARDPLPHGSLIIILMVATALGVFGATFQSTLSRSQEEQAMYSIGGNVVVKGLHFSDSVQEELASMPGIQTVSPVVRNLGTFLGVEPETLPDTAWFRDDFAGKGLDELLAPLRQSWEGSPGIPLPEDAEGVGIWVRADEFSRGVLSRTLNLWVRVADASGTYRSLLLGEFLLSGSGQEWTYLEASFPVGEPEMKRPLAVVSIFFSGQFGGSLGGLQPGGISLDDLSVKGGSAQSEGIVVEGYEETGTGSSAWVSLPNVDSYRDRTNRTPEAARSGRFGLSFSWQQALGSTPRGVLIPAGPIPLPVIGGPTFHVGQRVRVESAGQLVPAIVRDVTDYFPTISPSSPPFLLVDVEEYRQYIRRMPGLAEVKRTEELWISLSGVTSRSRAILSLRAQLSGVNSIRDREFEAELARRNPLAGGGWNGLTILSMSALTLAVAVALSIYSVVSVHTGRVDLTVGGALGFSRLQVILSLVLERIVVAIIGIAAGSAVGIWLSRWVLGLLDVTVGGGIVVPPKILTVHGGLMALVYVDLVAALAIAIVVAVVAALRLKASNILRTGQ